MSRLNTDDASLVLAIVAIGLAVLAIVKEMR